MNAQHPIIIIGLDSAEPELIERWLREGRLPFMRSLIKRGTWTRLQSSAEWLSDTPWVNFHTGLHSGQHGYYNFLPLERGTNRILRVDPRWCHNLPFWSLFRQTAQKIAIFDVPKTYPMDGINGIQIAAWGEEYPLMSTAIQPTEFAAEFSARFGRYPQVTELINARRIAPELKIYRTLMANIRKKRDAVQQVLKQDNWDLFMTVFGECHYGNHQFFHHFDPTHWGHDANKAAQLGAALPNLYTELDSALAVLLGDVSADATVLILSVHGIKTNYCGNHLMATVMEKLGFQVSATPEQRKTPWLSLRQLSKITKKIIPGKFREWINDHLVPTSVHDRMLSWQFSSRIDWQRSRAFFMSSSIFQSLISINLKGREPNGIVEPGEEYDTLCREICDELRQLVNPATGQPAVKAVGLAAQLFPGENTANLPDILIQWADDAPINQLQHPRIGLISEPVPALRKTQHSGEGFLIAAGNSIQQSAVVNNPHILDLAPTILHLMGHPIPDQMEGRVLFELLSTSSIHAMCDLKPETHEFSGAMGYEVPHRSRKFMGFTGFLESRTSRSIQ